MSDGFVASTAQLNGGTPVISITGEVDLATVSALERLMRGATENPTNDVIVDLTGCDFLDAGGLAVLNEARALLARSNRALALVLSKSIVLTIFEITGFDKRFAIYPSLGAAVEANARSEAHV